MRHERDAHLSIKLLEALPLGGPGNTVRELIETLGLICNRNVERRIQRQLVRLCESDLPRVERVAERLDNDPPRAIRYRRLPAPSAAPKNLRFRRLHLAIEAKLVLDHLRPVLPFELAKELAANLLEAESSLEQLRRARKVVWTDRIRVVPAGHPLKPPQVDPDVQREVESAIDQGRQLRMRYDRGPEGSPKEIVCHPQGLLLRPPSLYLIARTNHRPPVQYALHRVIEAEALASPADTSEFDFDAYLQSGAADMAWGTDVVRVVVATKAAFAKIWAGTPLGEDQTIARNDDAEYPWKVSANVPNTHLLRGYLLSLGTEAIVLEPPEIVEWVVEQADTMAHDIRERLKQLGRRRCRSARLESKRR